MADYDWEQHIALLAYYSWEAAGRPDGEDQKFWFEAIEEYKNMVQNNGGQDAGPKPALGD